MKRFTGKCLNCGKTTDDQRKGLCFRCYQIEYHGRDLDSECEICGFGDLRMLVRRKIDNNYHTLCGNCAVLLGRRKVSIDQLYAERFSTDDRRQGERRKNPVRRTYDRRDGIDPRLVDREDVGDRRDDEDRRDTDT